MQHTDEEIRHAAERLDELADAVDPESVEVDRTDDLRAIAEAADAVRTDEARLREAVAIARARGRSWNRIAVSLGVSVNPRATARAVVTEGRLSSSANGNVVRGLTTKAYQREHALDPPEQAIVDLVRVGLRGDVSSVRQLARRMLRRQAAEPFSAEFRQQLGTLMVGQGDPVLRGARPPMHSRPA